MWLAERFRKLVKPKSTAPFGEKKETVETPPKTIYFYDLRDKQKAKEKGLKPGYYLTVIPITKQEIGDPGLLTGLSDVLSLTMLEAVPLPKSGTRIIIDAKGNYTDPNLGWLFSPVGYILDQQKLIVRADHMDPDETQRIIVKSLSQKKY